MQRYLFNKKEIADILGVDEKTIYNWSKIGLPFVGNGKNKAYNIKDVIKWRKEQEANNSYSAKIENDEIDSLPILEQINIYKRDCLKNESELKELKVMIEKGEYILKSEVVENISNGFIMFKKGLLNLSTKLITLVDNFLNENDKRKVSNDVDELLKDCLNKISKGDEYK